MRKDELTTGYVYHVFTKSIAGMEIFCSYEDYFRMLDVVDYYRDDNHKCKFSKSEKGNTVAEMDKVVEIIAYCVMPTHIHLVLKQLKECGISKYMANVLNSYTRYFNTRYDRKGPLWEGRFKSVLVKSDEQLVHLTRYLHLNPVTAYLVNKPDEWELSSYREYVKNNRSKHKLCDYEGILDINPSEYGKFCNDQIDFQRELAKVNSIVLEKVTPTCEVGKSGEKKD